MRACVVVAALGQAACVQCRDGEVRQGNQCLRPCNVDSDCAGTQRCEDGVCQDGQRVSPTLTGDGGIPDAARAPDAATRDASAPDAHGGDAGARDASRDAGGTDAGGVDATVPDAGPPDATLPDAGGVDAGGGPLPCPAVNLGGATCDVVCPTYRLLVSEGYDPATRSGLWMCGGPSSWMGTSVGGGWTVTPVSPTLRTRAPLAGGPFWVR
ncbi:MAG: EB domain-containing protein [Myxococcota bacterium]